MVVGVRRKFLVRFIDNETGYFNAALQVVASPTELIRTNKVAMEPVNHCRPRTYPQNFKEEQSAYLLRSREGTCSVMDGCIIRRLR